MQLYSRMTATNMLGQVMSISTQFLTTQHGHGVVLHIIDVYNFIDYNTRSANRCAYNTIIVHSDHVIRTMYYYLIVVNSVVVTTVETIVLSLLQTTAARYAVACCSLMS